MNNINIYVSIFLIILIIYFMFKPYFNYKYEILKLKTHYNLLRLKRMMGSSNY